MNRKMKKYRYIISAVAAVPLYPSFYPPAHQARRAMHRLPHRVFRLRLRKVPEARREIQAARKVTIKTAHYQQRV